MHKTQNFLIGFILILVLAIAGMYFYFESSAGQQMFGDAGRGGDGRVTRLSVFTDEVRATLENSSQNKEGATYTDQQLVEYADLIGPSVRSGDNEQAVQAINLVLDNKEQFPVEAKSRAAFNSGVTYTASGEFADVIRTLQEYKASIDNPDTSDKWRARTLNNLAFAYCGYGRDDRIMEEIFKDGVYADILAQEGGNAMAAGKKLFEWSYSIYPTPRAAVLLARGAAMEAAQIEGNSTKKEQLIQTAERFLAEGAQLATAELARTEGRQNSYSNSRRYFSYLHWRNFTRATLAVAGVQKYRDTYRRDYEDLFAFMPEQGLENTKEYESSCYMMYGYFLENIDGDTELAQEYFDKSVDVSENYDNGTNYFEVFVRNMAANPGDDFLSDVYRFTYDNSERFKNYVDSL